MALTILEILHMPFGIPLSSTPAFSSFYENVEDLITSATNRDTEILNLYDIILETIDGSLLSDAKQTKTWFTDIYEQGRETNRLQNESYYIKITLFVKQLQLLVLDRYPTIDNFYEDEVITVSQIFADISENAGYPISPQYIEDIS